MKFRGKRLWKLVFWEYHMDHGRHLGIGPWKRTLPQNTMEGAFRKAYSLLLEPYSPYWEVNKVEIWYGDFTHPEIWPLEKIIVLKKKGAK